MKTIKPLVLLIAVSLCVTAYVAANGQQQASTSASSSGLTGTITIQSGYPDIANGVYKVAAKDFMAQNPGAKVQVVSYALREHEQKYFVGLASGTAPDIIATDPSTIQQFVQAGLIDPATQAVTSYINTSVSPNVRHFYRNSDGSYKGLPYFHDWIAMVWNKTMFGDAGLSHAPQNWQQLVDYATKLTKRDSSGKITRSGISLRLSGGGSGVAEKFTPFLYQAGGRVIQKTSDGKYHAGYDNQAGYDSLNLFLDLLYKYKVDDFNVKADAGGFALKTTAMFERGAWVTGYFKQHSPNIKYDISLTPSKDRNGSIDANMGFFVPKSSKYSKLAWKFALFLTNAKYEKILLSQTGWVPVRDDVDYSSIISTTPQLGIFFKVPKDFGLIALPGIKPANQIQTALAQRLVNAYRDKSLYNNPAKIKAFLHTAADETNSLLKNAGLYGG